MPSSDETPKNKIYFGLREHLMVKSHANPESAADAKPLRSATAPRRVTSLAATVALANALMLTATGDAQTPVSPETVQAKPGTAPGVTVNPSNEVTELPEVVVRAPQDSYRPEAVDSRRYSAPLLDVPQTVTVIPQAVIEQQGATTLRDVLRNVPGISIQAGEGGTPAGDNLSIRGFNARTDTFIDNVRDIGGYTRDPFNLEQVEVVKGPASTYTGRGSTGGSINLVTKTPRLEPFYSGSLSIGTEQYTRGTFDINQPLSSTFIPGMALRLNTMWTDADTPGRDEVRYRRWGIAPSVAFGLGTPTQVSIDYMHLDQDNVPDYGIPWVATDNNVLRQYRDRPAPVNFGNYYGLTERDYEKTRTDVATLQVDHSFSETLDLRYVLRYGRNERDSIVAAPRFLNPDSTLINRELKSRDQVDTILANQIDVTWKFATWGLEHTVVTGLEYDYETSKNYLRDGPATPNGDLFNPDPQDHYNGSIFRNGGYAEAISNTFAAYLFDTVTINEQWQISGGLRWDYFAVNFDSKDAAHILTSKDSIDKMLSWRIGAVYKPLPNGSIYAAYGTSFNPSAEGLTLATRDFDLDPEETRSVELGTKWDFFDNRLAVTGAVFHIEKTNARTPALLPDDPPNVLDGEQRVTGFELGIAGSITDKWKIYGGYTYLDSAIEATNVPGENGNELPNAPRNTFTMWTTYQLPWKIQVGAGAQFIDTRFTSTNNLREAPSYWLYDAMVSYEISENVTARINVYNLADEEYIDRVGGGHFVPGPGRWGMLTVSFRF